MASKLEDEESSEEESWQRDDSEADKWHWCKKCRQGVYGTTIFEKHNEKVHSFLNYLRYGNRKF